MIEKLMTLLVGILLTLAGWSLSRTFQLSTIQAVHEDKVERLEKHVDKLERHVEKLQDKMEMMTNKDEEIMEQHKKLFEALEDNQPSTGYSYN